MRKIRVGYVPFQLVFDRDVDFEACPLSAYIEQTDGDVIFGGMTKMPVGTCISTRKVQ